MPFFTVVWDKKRGEGMFGLLAYIMILGLETASDAAEKIAEIQKAEIYKELAQKDMLTKCYNRNAYSTLTRPEAGRIC